MRLIAALTVAFVALWSQPVFSQSPLPPADQAAIRDTITKQLEAFKRDDGNEAYSYAAPNVKAVFPDVERFMSMVKQGYTPVYRPQSYKFLELEMVEGRLQQKVEILGPDNDYWTAVYSMERQADGVWRITGCYLIKVPSGAA